MKSKLGTNFLMVFLAVFGVRLILSFLPSFDVDMGTWLGWAARMAEVGPAGFYSEAVWTQYTPLSLYWLWFIGKLGILSPLAIKIPVVFADIATALIIREIVKTKSQKWADFSFLLYTLNPVVIFTGSVWGQIDGVLALLMLSTAYFFFERRLRLGGVMIALSFLLKPQALVLLPPLFFVALIRKYTFRELFSFVFDGLLVVLLLSLPFFPSDPIFGVFRLVLKMTDFYHYTSVFAFNFWSLVGMWKPDDLLFLGITYHLWGVVLYLLALTVIFYRFRKDEVKTQYLVFALSILASFLFPTRVHERYLFPAFSFLLTTALLSESVFLILGYVTLSLLSLINLYHPYAYYSDNFLVLDALMNLTGNLAPVVGILGMCLFFALQIKRKRLDEKLISLIKQIINKSKALPEKFPKTNLDGKTINMLLMAVLVFAFVTRVYSLASPRAEYFDEVYHAFTAREMLHGNIKAWEWWHAPPEGFAYEWTHPPVAKFGMVLGMAVLGENSLGWRIPGAILGIISVYLVYLLGKTIFKDPLIGIMASAIFALDGVVLVISRIGMNDIYFLTFAMASLYFFLKKKNFWSAMFFGLSLASKWSVIWLIPVIFAAHILYKRKLNPSYIFFIVIPPLIYLASYIPFFEGHTFKQFFNFEFINCIGKTNCTYEFGLQQQMWWYHTNLNATHAYTSPWWSWPLNLRPVYFYTSEVLSGMVSRIYLIGNPMVFWGGLVAALLGLFNYFKTRNKKVGFVVFSYFVFFMPWALSPRIMFLYHYLPSIPFLAIAMAWCLRKYPFIIPAFFISTTIIFLYFFPHWSGLSISEWLDISYYWLPSWR